ncbi:sensor histidine kinase [Amycolatopsis suaedae]|uniref:histidine kinase n=1 Tax=Amycolatopsis suaedae TaxID=2510978 RepID=A0A4Q7JC32_9PSEU|nr:ATP-binding protein [Amycolatopsis suaedae]RZQ63844.1 ATP-binding protein [Amycolatopsis suaedae]
MATRARELLDRSRSLLDRSRAAAAQFLAAQRQAASPQVTQRPVIEAAPPRPAPGEQDEVLAGVCASVSLRDLNLVDSLLAQLEQMEAREDDEERLAQLYRLDHLATRLRRNAENLRVLAGREASDNTTDTTSVVDVIRAGMSSIDHYTRVTIGRVVPLGVVGFAADDVSRVVAELLDNATRHSPPNAPVRVSAHLTEQGSVLLRIEDEGIGLPGDRLSELNDRLTGDPVLDHDSVRHMGLAVVRRVASRHGIRVRLERRIPHGTTATTLLPAELVSELAEASWSGTQTVVFPRNAAVAQSGGTAEAAPEPPPVTRQSSLGKLPRRHAATAPATAVAEEPPRRKPSPVPVSGGTTAGGLPRRVPRSIKGTGEDSGPPEFGSDLGDNGHEQLIGDLGAFTEGEQAALDERRTTTADIDTTEDKQA